MVFSTVIDRRTYNVKMKYQAVTVKADLLRMCQTWPFFHTKSYNAVISLSRELPLLFEEKTQVKEYAYQVAYFLSLIMFLFSTRFLVFSPLPVKTNQFSL